MVEAGDNTQPFSKESLASYRKETGNTRISSQAVQKAMDGLVTNGFVWRSARGVYALDDTMITEFCFDDLTEGALLQELALPEA